MNGFFFPQAAQLAASVDPCRAPLPKSGPDNAQFSARFQRALDRPISWMPLSGRKRLPEQAYKLRVECRADLETLVLARRDEPVVLQKILDLIDLIIAEETWAEAPDPMGEDMSRPAIDLFACETAVLFAWTSLALTEAFDAISPRIRGRMLYEVRRRIFAPLLAHGDYAVETGKNKNALAAILFCLQALLLMETDDARLLPAAKKLLKTLDELSVLPPAVHPLSDRAGDIFALADTAYLVRRMTGTQVDWTQTVPSDAQLDEVLLSHISGPYFFDPTGASSVAGLSGADVFRLGRLVGDRNLMAMGADLFASRKTPSQSVTGRMLDWMHADAIAAETAPSPRPAHGALEDGRMLFARGEGYSIALTNGAGYPCAGNFALYVDDAPVFVPEGEGNLARLADAPLLPARPAAEWEFKKERAILGVDLTKAYARERGVRAHQRTLVLSKLESSVQLVDVFDLERPQDILFTFTSVHAPFAAPGGVQFGPLLLEWEGDPETDVLHAPHPDYEDGVFTLTLTYKNAVPRSMFTFFLERA